MGGGWGSLRFAAFFEFCVVAHARIVVCVPRCHLRCELGLGGLEPRGERLPGVLVGVVGAHEEPDPGRVVGYLVEGIFVCGKVGFFYGLRRRRILTDLGSDRV